MANCHLIVCEKSARWAAALRSALQGNIRLVETRSLSQCSDALRAAPASLVAVEITAASLNSFLEFMGHTSRLWPGARVVVLLDAGLDSTEPLLREAGVIEVFTTTRDAPAIARLAQRQLALAPREELSLRQSIAERLPWSSWATAGFDVPDSVSLEG